MNTTVADTLFEEILTNTYTLNHVQKKIRLLKEFLYQKLYTRPLSPVIPESEASRESINNSMDPRRSLPRTLIRGGDDVIKAMTFEKDLKAEDLIYIKWIKTLKPELIDGITVQNFNEVFSGLESKASLQKVLLIYVAFDMPDPTITTLGTLLRSSYGPQFLFDVRFDPSLIGGCALVWNGIYQDYSLKKSINDNKDRILGEIRTFLKH